MRAYTVNKTYCQARAYCVEANQNSSSYVLTNVSTLHLDTAPHFVEGSPQSAPGEGTCVLECRVGKKGEVPIWTEALLVRRKGNP